MHDLGGGRSFARAHDAFTAQVYLAQRQPLIVMFCHSNGNIAACEGEHEHACVCVCACMSDVCVRLPGSNACMHEDASSRIY